MKFGLEVQVIENIISVLEQHPKVDKALVFGSRAKGNYRPDSDIDIAIKGNGITTDDIIAISVAIETKGITHKFDLIDYHSIKEPALKEHINRVGIEFYTKWKEIALGDVIDVKHGYAFNGKHIVEASTNNILVTPGNFHIGGGFKSSKYKYYNSDFPSDYILKPNDIVVTMTDLSQETDTLGYSAKIPKQDGINYLHNQRIGLVQFKSNDVDKNFIYWILRTKEYQGFIVGSASGTSIMHTAPTRIKEYSFLLPPIQEQTAIASILSSLDDKIDLLNRQNKTLEQLAETLYRQWFVEEAEESWETKTISEIIEVRDGTHDSPKQTETGRYLITSKHLKSTGIDFSTAYKISESDFADVNKRSKVDKDDILFSMIGTLGLIHYVDKEPDFAIKNMGLFKSSQKPSFARFLYLLLISPEGKKFVYENADGSTQEYITLSSLRNFEFKYPGDIRIEEFDIEIKPIFQKIESNQTQIRTLTQTRDTLLPKLMSGEVRVEM